MVLPPTPTVFFLISFHCHFLCQFFECLVGVSGSERPEVLFICHRGADKKGSALFMQTPAAGKKHSLPHLSPNMCILDSFPIYLLLTTTALFPKSRLRRWTNLNTLFAVQKRKSWGKAKFSISTTFCFSFWAMFHSLCCCLCLGCQIKGEETGRIDVGTRADLMVVLPTH